MARARTSAGSRPAGMLSLLAALTSALALTGAAVYTVGQAACEPGQYIRHDSHVELVGGCVDGEQLRRAGVGQAPGNGSTGTAGASHSNYRP
ncbi:hypothetical protein SacmaDRAFT_4458 [Saccharomonospora marina XMU15]|uniref:Secreted protein n=1 Tax=Saccharomonospora marina XMU15 TaxID=882083 RepID=H5XAT3_9PSEU|nr:hypothetical protein [Saccharomonospora marina]EHR52643.1 hypothetical protein SacmaDRAFT_4458 [Saccharomonospora marina XMU15]